VSLALTALARLGATAMSVEALDLALVTENASALLGLGFPEPDAILAGDLRAVAEANNHAVSSALSTFLSDHCVAESLLVVNEIPLACGYVIGVCMLKTFLRANFTGPPLKLYPETQRADLPDVHAQLAMDGEDVSACAKYPHILLQAKVLLVDSLPSLVRAGYRYAPWWAARVCLAHTAVLTRPTPTLHKAIFTNFSQLLGPESSAPGTLKMLECGLLTSRGTEKSRQVAEYPSLETETHRALSALTNLELAAAQLIYFDPDGASRSIEFACRLSGIRVRAEGHLGVRTKFQQSAVSQLVAHAYLVPGTSRSVLKPMCSSFPLPACPNSRTDGVDRSRIPTPQNVPLDDSDVLGFVKLANDKAPDDVSEGTDRYAEDLPDLIDNLSPVEQAIVLGHASGELARNAENGLTDEQAAAYVALVLDSAKSSLGTSSVVQIRALLMRTGFERERGRYMERNLKQLEMLGTFIDTTVDEASQDLLYAAAIERNSMTFASGIPPQWELKKELAVCFGRLGLVKSAMKIFRELECWDELVDCHRLIGNLGAAETIVREQLDVLNHAISQAEIDVDALAKASSRRTARRPRLLCVLGDILRDEKLYVQAWEESLGRCGRAKRSLGRIAVERKQWAEAVIHYRSALELNPLYPDVWFTCGCAAIEAGLFDFAATAFTRVVQETPRNGEAWNNLGRVLCELYRMKEGLSALLEAAKYKRESWRIWDNVLLIAVRLRSTSDIVKSLTRLLDLRGKDAVSASAIQVAVDGILHQENGALDADEALLYDDKNARAVASKIARELLQVLARATTLVSSDASLWEAYARLHAHMPDRQSKRKSAECRQKQIRVLLPMQGWKSEIADFCAMVEASSKFATTALESGDEGLIYASKMHVDSVLCQAQHEFSSDEAYKNLMQTRAQLESGGPASVP
jgi:tetratricopeptide (TPR) repeat protein